MARWFTTMGPCRRVSWPCQGRGAERERDNCGILDFLDLMHLDTVAECCSGVFFFITLSFTLCFLLSYSSPSLSLEVSPSGEHPNDFTAQHDSLIHGGNAEVFYFSVSLLHFFLLWSLSPTCCKWELELGHNNSFTSKPWPGKNITPSLLLWPGFYIIK